MTWRRRWLLVAVVAIAIAMAPFAVSLIPAGHSAVSATALLRRITTSDSVAFSGYAEVDGSLGLPDVGGFGDLARLLGGRTDLRVWWRGAKMWRVDAVAFSGETDVHRDRAGLWTWDYERNRATRLDYRTAPAARLPRADDLAPGSLARRLLAQAVPRQVHRIADRRVAGRDAAGIELVPNQAVSTISRVDVWALPTSGLPVAVAVYPRGGTAVMSTTMLDLSTSTPPDSAVGFGTPPPEVFVEHDQVTNVVSALDQFVHTVLPARLAGLARASGSTAQLGSVGVYGQGVTSFAALPLPPQFAFDVASRLSSTVTVAASTLSLGPLELRLTPQAEDGSRWLLVGTVTAVTLKHAQRELPPVGGVSR